MKTTFQLAIVGMILLTACKKNAPGINQSLEPTYSSTNSSLSQRGQATTQLVYHDTMLVKMNLKQFSEKPAESHMIHHKSINVLYMANGFLTVANAIQGDRYSTKWREVDIVFNAGFFHDQFYSEAEILAAAAGNDPRITLIQTTRIYQGGIIQHTQIQ